MSPAAGGPIFIVGSMRSGSTMLRLILDSHPHIAIPSETGFMGGAVGARRIPDWTLGERWFERLGWTEAEFDRRLGAFYAGMFERYAAEQGKPRWGEKTPFHTTHMPLMGDLFPDACFVGIVRHPGAVVSSLRQRFHYGLAEAVDYWSEVNSSMLEAGVALGDRFVLCRYEDLVLRSEPVLRELLDLLGEPWAAEVMEHHRVQRERGAPRAAEGGTITSHPVDGRRASAWVDAVGVEEVRELRRVASLAEALGYDVAGPDVGPDWLETSGDPRLVVTGRHLASHRGVWSAEPRPDLSAGGRPHLADMGAEELAARLMRTEAALARVRSRRAVRLVDALRRVQHGRTVADVAAAWRVVRDARSESTR